eukprot:5357165-Amphidinium_carterae.1
MDKRTVGSPSTTSLRSLTPDRAPSSGLEPTQASWKAEIKALSASGTVRPRPAPLPVIRSVAPDHCASGKNFGPSQSAGLVCPSSEYRPSR